MKKRILALLTAAVMLLVAGCGGAASGSPSSAPADAPAQGAYKAGTYSAAAKGMGGDVNVSVTFSESAITEVKVGEHSETAGICEAPIEKIPAAVVEHQSLMIDAVAGATMTSNAILAAVADCVTQAGGDAEAWKTKAVETVQQADETIDADVVVVGAGIAGLSAAIEAASTGAKVVLLEKMGATGGSSITCGGEILAAGTQMQKDQNITDSADDLTAYWIKKGEGHVSEEILGLIGKNNAETIPWLQAQGVEFQGVTTPTSMPWQDPMRCHKTADGTGAGFILPLTETAKAKGVDIRLETPVVSLVTKDGTVTGVTAENAGRTVTVNAKTVLLATGGFGNNAELMKQYSPQVGISGVHVGDANNGDGLVMARDAGAEIVAGGGAIALSIDMGPTNFFEPYGQFLYVNPKGERFMNEAEYWFARSRKLLDMGGACYAIIDSKTKNENWDKAVEAGTVVKADTLEELAGKLSMDPTTLKATVDKYNGFCATGVDSEFSKPASRLDLALLTAVDQGPFYGLNIKLNSLSGTFGGPKINVSGQVISTTGQAIPGLYAAGEVANGEMLYKEYPCSGSAIQLYCSMGRIAGTAAAKEALGQ